MSTRKKGNDEKPTAGHRRAGRPVSPRKRAEEPEEVPPASFSRMEIEQQMADLSKLMADQDFENVDEAKDFLRNLLEDNDGKIPHRQPETAAEKAQELIFEAIDAPDRRARKLIKDALKLDPDCVDAYILLGEMADSLPDAIAEFRKAVAAGERSLGADVFEEDRGAFWGMIETRPYMRALRSLATSVWNYGEVDEAVQLYQEILSLNPGDNQGVRYALLDALLLLRRHDEAAELLDQFDDSMANWAYNEALLLFRTEGRSENAIEALETALEVNEFVPDYLLGYEPMPDPDEIPDFISFGDETEAISYVFGAFPLWAATPGAQYWLSEYAE
ncbi:MAG: hypothetical protein DWI57_14950 [Chloroflexi bacterium]|nr:MAG: hypothetical protein DWI57_14950 [Chloroflexota bacterium]